MINLQKRRPEETSKVCKDEWFEHFASLHQAENATSSHPNLADIPVKEDDLLDRDIEICEVQEAINKLKSGKSPGEDGLGADIFKHIDQDCMEALTAIYNKIYSSGEFPTSWSTGIIHPIHKSGPKDTPDNFRGITLLNIVCKIFTNILQSRLQCWAAAEDILNECQFGFHTGRSTTDAIFVVNALIEKSKHKKKPLYCAFGDFKKAFDSVDHTVSSKIIQMMANMYTKARAQVKTPEGPTDTFQCNIGVRQGCPLSPLLFSLFVNDLPDAIAKEVEGVTLNSLKVRCLMFADDLVLLADRPEGLQNSIDILGMYCRTQKLTVNVKKTKVLVFGRKANHHARIWKYQEHTIETVHQYKYLGVLLTSKGNFNECVKALANKGHNALFQLTRNMKDFLGLEVNTQCHLFHSMIKPILSYGCGVWGTREYDVLEKVLLHFCRAILGVGPKCTKAAMLGELGRLPLYIWHQQRTARYLTRIMRGTNSSLLNDAMQLSICMAKDGFHSWVWHVVTFVNNLDIPAELESLPQCLKEISNEEIQERLKNEYINKWRTVLWDDTPRGSGGGNKLRTYRTIKAQYEIEHYLYTIKIREHRVAMAKLRLSCHPLRIETGRYNRPYLSAPHRYCYF